MKSLIIPDTVTDIGIFAYDFEYYPPSDGGFAVAFDGYIRLTIYCHEGTAAQKHAIDYGFESMGEENGFLKYTKKTWDMPGDVDDDYEMTVNDITAIASYIKGMGTLKNEAAGDVDGDGEITVNDITAIASHIKGIEPLF